MKITTSIDMSGPFFEGDPTKKLHQNLDALKEAMAREGAEDVRTQLRATQGTRAPVRRLAPTHVSDHIIGRTRSLAGKRWVVTAVVGVNNSGFTPKQGKSLMAAARVVEARTHVFRRTTGRLRRLRAINRAELSKGLE